MKTTARKPPRPRESEIQASGMALLRTLGWRVFRRNTGAMTATYKGRDRFIRFSEPGQSDCWAVLPDGRHGEVEFKRPGEWPTAAQLAWLRSMNGVGGSVAFWVSDLKDLEEVARHVQRGGKIEYVGDEGQYQLVR